MPSYTAYKRQVMDADDNITWITMNGNHIPIKEGQTKEEAVKEFLAKKGEGSAKHGSGEYKAKSEHLGGRINTNIDPNREKAGKTKYDPSDDFATQLYKHKKDTQSKGEGSAKSEPKKNTFLSNPNTLKEFANHFGISESAAKKAAEKYGDEFYNTMVKDPMKGVGMAVGGENKTELAPKESKSPFPQSFSDPNEAQRLSGIEKPKTEKHKDLRSAFGKHYDKLYNDRDLDDKSGYLLDEWDKHIQNPEFKKIVQEFVQERGDFISSDREVKAFMLAAKEKGLIPQEKKPAKKKETIADVFEKYKSTSINNHEEWDTNYEKMQKAINKEYTVENVQNWTAYREGISFGGSDYGEYGTNAKITVSKNLKDLLLSLPEHKQKDLIEFIRVHSGRPYSSEHIDPYEFMKALKNGKENNGKTTVNIKTITHGWFDD